MTITTAPAPGNQIRISTPLHKLLLGDGHATTRDKACHLLQQGKLKPAFRSSHYDIQAAGPVLVITACVPDTLPISSCTLLLKLEAESILLQIQQHTIQENLAAIHSQLDAASPPPHRLMPAIAHVRLIAKPPPADSHRTRHYLGGYAEGYRDAIHHLRRRHRLPRPGRRGCPLRAHAVGYCAGWRDARRNLPPR